ncbi:MAG: Maf family protein [Bacteroidota bacterium]
METSLDQKIKNFPYKIILASASPRRQELLRSLGFHFSVQPSHADETYPEHLSKHEIPLYLADKKAKAFGRELSIHEILITADTVVWCNNKIYNKPVDFYDAKKMLQALSGKMHQVYTAVCLRGAHKTLTFYDESKVYFKNFKDDEIEYYLLNFKPYDKAGAYGVQDWLGYIGIDKIEGSFYNVIGLPVKPLFEHLMQF